MRVVVDTGVFSASLSRRRRPRFESQIGLMAGHQIFLAAVTVGELRLRRPRGRMGPGAPRPPR